MSSTKNIIENQDAGGLKEWNTDMGVDEESVLESNAAALKKKAEQEDICVPIGEGENCFDDIEDPTPVKKSSTSKQTVTKTSTPKPTVTNTLISKPKKNLRPKINKKKSKYKLVKTTNVKKFSFNEIYEMIKKAEEYKKKKENKPLFDCPIM
jgi:hypothetical protein